MTVRPLHPEVHGLLAEVLGLTDDVEGMKRSVQMSVALFERPGNRAGVSSKATASVVHKLATTYLGVLTSIRIFIISIITYYHDYSILLLLLLFFQFIIFIIIVIVSSYSPSYFINNHYNNRKGCTRMRFQY